MNKYVVGFIVGAIMATTISVYAEDGLEKVEAYLRKGLPITLNGDPVQLENPPVMYDGSTHLRLRDVAKIFGTEVNWNETTQTVELKNSSQQTGGAPAVSTPVQPNQPPEWAGQVIIYPPTEPKEEQKAMSLEEVNSLIEFYNIKLKTTNSGLIGARNGNNVEAAERLEKEIEDIKSKIADLEKQKAEMSSR